MIVFADSRNSRANVFLPHFLGALGVLGGSVSYFADLPA
jgi:hypothetical protein